MRKALLPFLAGGFALAFSSSEAKIQFTLAPGAESGTALLSSGSSLEPNIERWRTGAYDGWGACLFIRNDAATGEALCGCLDRQLSAVGAQGVMLALVGVQSCARTLIEGAWTSNWGQAIATSASVTFTYDPATKRISGCWADAAGDGSITGLVRDGAFDANDQRLTFAYEDLRRGAKGKATLNLFNTPSDRRLLGRWRDEDGGLSGAWTMSRDPVRRPLDCAAPKR